MRLGYGVMRNDPAETGAALGYWAAVLSRAVSREGAAPVTDDPAEVLLVMQTRRGVPACRAGARSPLALHARGRARSRNFAPVVDQLAIGPETHRPRRAMHRSRSTPARSTFARCMR